jgi:urea transport system permease protein
VRLASKRAAFVAALFTCLSFSTWALDRAQVEKLASDDNDEKIAAIAALVAEGDPKAADVLKQAAEGEIEIDGKKVEVVMNNRVRGRIAEALSVLKLLSKEKSERREAATALASGADASMLPLVLKAKEKETEPDIKAMLEMSAAGMQIRSEDRAIRLAAIRTLGASAHPVARALLTEAASDADAEIRSEAQRSLSGVQSRLVWGEWLGLAFAGVSLGSILLLAALGLAITYGLMGVINMAHGELIMIGAYTTYVVQNFFRGTPLFDWYLLAAVPAAFLVSAFMGMILERSVIRWLYGRPLETLLATWGISLVLIQAVRTIFGAQNVQVENPAFMSGGIQVLANVVMPWSRIWIIVFAAFVLVLVYLLLSKTRLGLFIRGVTQNRDMAACVGVPTARIDTWAFGLGSGIAGLAGCALSQLGNVGPDLGQGYIVDSFLVVVFGGVGQLAGTVYAALGLGFANKLLESWSGAVLAKIALLVFIIIFIQRRPQGLFALKGRAVEA